MSILHKSTPKQAKSNWGGLGENLLNRIASAVKIVLYCVVNGKDN